MRLAVDIREACRPQRSGKGQWVFGFVSELLRRNTPMILLTDAPLPAAWARAAATVHIFSSGWRFHLQAARFLKSEKGIDAFVSPTSFIVPVLVGNFVRTVLVIHDMIAFRSEPHDRKARWIERLLLPMALRRTCCVVTISEATKRDLLERFSWVRSEKVTTVYAGPMRDDPLPAVPDGKTILCIATLCPRKNQERLIMAYTRLPDALRSRYHLVLAGARGWQDDEIVRLAQETPGVTWLGHVATEKYEQLLSTCMVFALPSLYEGFGLQILDALQRGIPVLTSACGSLAEVAGSAALCVDPESVDAIRSGLERLLSDDSLRQELYEKGQIQARIFTWKRTVDLFLESLSSVQ